MLISKQFQKNVLGNLTTSCGMLFLLANSLASFFDSHSEASLKNECEAADPFQVQKTAVLSDIESHSTPDLQIIDALDPDNGLIGFFLIKNQSKGLKSLRDKRQRGRSVVFNLVDEILDLKKEILSIEHDCVLFLC